MFDFFKKLFADKKIKTNLNKNEIGDSGIENYSGYFNEEYFYKLLNDKAADVYDKMRRSDTQISLAISSVINPIVGGRWRIDEHKDEDLSDVENDQYKSHADFIDHVLFNDLDKSWNKKLKEILTCIVFGHSVFERVHKVVIGHEKFGDYIGIKKLGYRSQKTIEKWNFDTNSKDFLGITQTSEGDIGQSRSVDIPAKNLLIFNIDADGDNLEGISMLRQCYGCYVRKEIYLKLMAIGIEKSAIGTPIGKFPSGEYKSAEVTNLRQSLQALTSHNKNYLLLPQRADGPNFEVEIMTIPFDSEKVKSAIEYEDMSIMRRFIAQFLMLGSSSTGSWALSTDQSDFFLNGIVSIADMIAEVLNVLIEELVMLNFGPQQYYPKLKHSRIKDKAGKEFAEVVKLAKDAGVIIPDDDLEKFMRQKYDLPEKQDGFSREEIEVKNEEKAKAIFDRNVEIADKKAPVEFKPDKKDNKKEVKIEDKKNAKDKEKNKFSEVSLAEPKARKQIKKASVDIVKVYQKELSEIGDDLVNQVVKNFNDAKTDLQKVSAARNIQPRNVSKYRKALGSLLRSITAESIDDVLELFRKNAKLSEILLKEKGDKGKKKAERFTVAQTDALVETQVGDLKNAVVLQFTSSINEDSAARIKQDLLERKNKKLGVIEAGSATVASSAVNKAREFMFFDKELVEEVESYTFVNPSPVALVCQSLAGQTFLTTDADSFRNTPPLHYNCKSVLSPNFRGAKNNPKAEGLNPYIDKTKDEALKIKKSINLSEVI